jgi:hypothetical protein
MTADDGIGEIREPDQRAAAASMQPLTWLTMAELTLEEAARHLARLRKLLEDEP